MDYIYNGEVQIFQEDLDRFLKVAQRFKMEGLLTDLNADAEEEENIQRNEYIKEETRYEQTTLKTEKHKALIEEIFANVSTDINPDNIIEVDEQIELNIVRNLDGTYSCKICGKNSGSNKKNMKHNLKNHIETHLEGLCFNCPKCEKTFRSRGALAKHKSRFHK